MFFSYMLSFSICLYKKDEKKDFDVEILTYIIFNLETVMRENTEYFGLYHNSQLHHYVTPTFFSRIFCLYYSIYETIMVRILHITTKPAVTWNSYGR